MASKVQSPSLRAQKFKGFYFTFRVPHWKQINGSTARIVLKRAIGLECNVITVRTIGLLCQISPFLNRKMSLHYNFHFIEHHFQLGDGIFRIRWNTQAMIFIYHELMPGSRVGAAEAKFP